MRTRGCAAIKGHLCLCENKKKQIHGTGQIWKIECVSTYVPVFDELWMIMNIRLSDTCKQGRRHTHVVQTAACHTTSLAIRTDSAFTVSHRLTRSRPPSLPATYQHEQLFQNSFYAPALLFWLTLSFSVCFCVCVCVCWPLINFPPSVVM